MPGATEPENANGASVKVGATGTVSSLMSRELNSTKSSPQPSPSSSRRRHQSAPVSVPCGASPRKAIQRKASQDDSPGSRSRSSSSSTRSSNGSTSQRSSSAQSNGNRVPILRSNDILADRNPNVDKAEKKGHAYIVEVVDLKCNNPMSSRLKKLGFSKLSESIA